MRKVHLRTQSVINLGHTRTYCGRVIYYVHPDTDLTSAVVDFGDFDATMHGTLVTCARCLACMYHPASAGEAGTAATTKIDAVHEHAVPKADAQ